MEERKEKVKFSESRMYYNISVAFVLVMAFWAILETIAFAEIVTPLIEEGIVQPWVDDMAGKVEESEEELANTNN